MFKFFSERSNGVASNWNVENYYFRYFILFFWISWNWLIVHRSMISRRKSRYWKQTLSLSFCNIAVTHNEIT